MLKTLQFNVLKNVIGMNKRCLWQWVDDIFNK